LINCAIQRKAVIVKSKIPNLTSDWITQRELAQLLGVSERTACLWAKAGKLESFEHGVPACGRRKYSKSLVHREFNNRWDRAVTRQDSLATVTTESRPGQ
jgi:predicted DNA-binding ArsR family transcriptional regulator